MTEDGAASLHPLLQRPLAVALLQVLDEEARPRPAASTAGADGHGGEGASAAPPPPASVSLPRLAKRLGVGASAVLRELTLMGDAALGGIPGPGWVRVTQDDGRWLAALTPAGRALAEWLADSAD